MKRQIIRSPQAPVVVAIPVRNEVEHIGPCLRALAEQVDVVPDHVVLLVNNTTDGTIAAARGVKLPPGMVLHVIERALPPELANAGQARRLAMEAADRLAGDAGVLLTTDADGQVDPDWLGANLAELARGADAVAGWCDLNPADWGNIPLQLHEDDARECAYDALCDEMHARLDPDPFDPMPRHTQNSGSSIAVTVAAYRAAGGVPPVACAEDRAFLAALRRMDARIRHSPACHVMVSGRIVGRAAGGMADTIRRRLTARDAYLDSRLEPAETCALRALLRRRFRAFVERDVGLHGLADRAGVDAAFIAGLRARSHFGIAWCELEAASPLLRPRLVSVEQLPAEMARAEQIVAALRVEARDGAEAELTNS
jgi:glycosyltransferase involved in cell wall biosynthesis